MKILGEALRRLTSPPLTERYPAVKAPAPEGFRGLISIDSEKCSGCGACSRVCPAKAVDVLAEGESIVIRIIQGRCILCGECVDACPFNAMKIVEEYENLGVRPDKVMAEARVPAVRCRACGEVFASSKVVRHVTESAGEEYKMLGDLCPKCREKLAARILSTRK